MNNKKVISLLLIVVSLVSLISFSIGVYAGGTLQPITAHLNYGLSVAKGGKVQQLKDANGNTVIPITYKDTTYLPIRSIANILGTSVDWDQDTQCVLLGGSSVPSSLKNNGNSNSNLKQYYTEADVTMLAKLMYAEARGISDKTELACLAWTVLNRVDAGNMGGKTIREVITSPNQFAYSPNLPTINDHGIDLKELARDVLIRWNKEKNGLPSDGRVLPKDYYWYVGDGKHNYYTNKYQSKNYWNYSLESPYKK